MIVDVKQLQDLCQGVLIRGGLGEEDAHIVTDILVEAELRGRPAHGVIRLPAIVERCKSSGRKPMRLARDGGAYALIDGQENLGYLVAHRCTRTAVGKAQARGVGVIGGFNTGQCGMLGYYTSMIADAGMVGVAMCDSGPRIVAWGSVEPVLGANPMSACFPAGKGQVLVDFSPASVTHEQILMAIKDGHPLPEGTVLDEDGLLTTDPEAGRKGGILPSGGHKGYALALMIQLLSGVLVRAAPVPEPGKNYGIFVLAINSSIFLSRELFQAGVKELIDRIKGARPAEGVGEILIPGERAFREREMRMQEGIGVEDELLEELGSL